MAIRHVAEAATGKNEDETQSLGPAMDRFDRFDAEFAAFGCGEGKRTCDRNEIELGAVGAGNSVAEDVVEDAADVAEGFRRGVEWDV